MSVLGGNLHGMKKLEKRRDQGKCLVDVFLSTRMRFHPEPI